ncbi:hypothetical protein CUM68_06015, partial [Enterococcus faecium]|uniref:hypothetical protein n=4 Tax=Enterococcus faecium TaxID=1352 RepID=UPI000D48D78C
ETTNKQSFLRHIFKQLRTIILYAQVTQNKILLINNKVISSLFFLFPNIFILSLFIYYEKEMRLRGEVTTKFLKKKYKMANRRVVNASEAIRKFGFLY